ncbi:MAG: hypothetical protein KAG53_04915 [Endozoicomonadaceae bacterium]|nr:hypothetical protein [Endozoicomonadaceae bacterium]
MESIKSTLNSNITTQPPTIKKVNGKTAMFVDKTVDNVPLAKLAILTIFFPITSVISGVKTFCHQEIKKKAVLFRFRVAISVAVFPIPLIGPILFFAMANNESLRLMYMRKEDVSILGCLILSIPFLSSLCSSYFILCPLTQNELNP